MPSQHISRGRCFRFLPLLQETFVYEDRRGTPKRENDSVTCGTIDHEQVASAGKMQAPQQAPLHRALVYDHPLQRAAQRLDYQLRQIEYLWSLGRDSQGVGRDRARLERTDKYRKRTLSPYLFEEYDRRVLAGVYPKRGQLHLHKHITHRSQQAIVHV